MTETPGLSVQLYSVRVEAGRDLAATIGRLAGMGYGAVEPVLSTGAPPALAEFARSAGGDEVLGAPVGVTELKRLLDEHGMVVSSAHGHLPEGDLAGAILDEQAILGNDLLVIPVLFDVDAGAVESFSDLDAIKRWAERFNRAAEIARGHGVRLGYHNHFWEFGTAFDDGRTGYDIFWDLVDDDLVAEVDIHWAYAGGVDPADLVRRLGPRVELLHVKDGTATPGEPQVAVGSGELDIPAILGAAGAARWHVVELDDCAGDMFDALDASARYLVEKGLTRERVA